MGRVGVDLYPMQLEVPLEDVEGFHKYVGGFAGNVATGLARLGVRVAIVSAVGDDGHGRFVRRFLESEGVDCRWLSVHPALRTALAFCEAWPPDSFPITFYRTPDLPRLGADAGGARPGRRSRRRRSPTSAAPASPASRRGWRRWPSSRRGRRGRNHRARPRLAGRRCGTTRPTTPPCMRRLPRGWPTSCSARTRRSPRRSGPTTPAALLALGAAAVAQKHGPDGVTVHAPTAGARAIAAAPGRGRERPRRGRRVRGGLRLEAAARRHAPPRRPPSGTGPAPTSPAGSGCSVAMPTEGDLA